jgi:hypothetical protein
VSFFRFTAASVVALAGLALPPPKAVAAPPGFPDLNAFTAVDPAPYIGGGVGAPSINFHFTTPDGVLCRWQYDPSPSPNTHVVIRCSGNIAGIPSDDGPGCAQLGANGIFGNVGPYSFSRGVGDCPPFAAWLHLLDVGQKVTATNITCAVGAGNLTACIDETNNRGFVLQPSGSWVF